MSTTGELKQHPRYNRQYRCVDCDTMYINMMYWDRIDDTMKWDIRCNGHTISLCPWCRPDSRPHFAGRGV